MSAMGQKATSRLRRLNKEGTNSDAYAAFFRTPRAFSARSIII